MDEAVDLALKNSPVVLGSAAELNAAVGRLRSARAEMRPWLSANAFASGGGGTGIVATPPPTQPAAIMGLPGGRFADLNLSLMLPLVTSGRLEGMVRQAAALRHASEADLATQRQEVTLMTRTAYHDVQARRAMVGVAQARLKENEERLKNDAARLKQQSIPEYYLRRDEAEVASARQDVTNAQRDVDISLVGLKTVIGVSPASQLDVTGDLDSPNTAEFLAALTAGSGAQPDDTLSALLNLAERKRPELMAGSRRVEGARADTTSVRGSYLPQLSLGVMGDWMKAGSMNASARTTAAVIASIPLYSGGQREGRIREAEGMREKQEQDLRQVALQVAQDVQNALLNLRAADQNVGAAQAGQKAAESEYAAAQLRYQVGRSVAAEMLDSLASRVRAQSDVVQALYLYNVARDQLLRAVGGLGASPPS
jgi:outer membrane protein TolC